MKIVISAQGNDLNAPASPRFGRCPTYIFVETETMAFEALVNPAMSAPGGAGIQAAQFVVEQGAEAVLTGNVGPNAANVLQAANIPIYFNNEATVGAAAEAFKAGKLASAGGANVTAHAGMGMGQGRGMGMGRGMGRGMGQAAPPMQPSISRDEEVAALRELTANLRQQLADAMDRIGKLEKEN